MIQRFFILFFVFLIFINFTDFIFGTPLSTISTTQYDLNENPEKIPLDLEEEDEYDTYISLYFKGDCEYPRGFKNEYRESISYIINRENNVRLIKEEALMIHKGFEVEIHFNNIVRNLENFFSREIDENMEYLVRIDFDNFDSSLVTNMKSMFHSCYGLEIIDLTKLNTSSVEHMYNMFNGCVLLTSIDLTQLDMSNVISMGNMFNGCASLKSINLSNLNTSSLNDMSSVFFNCKLLETVILSNMDTSKVNDMSNMFYDCSSLKSINLSNLKTSSVLKIDKIFYGCNSLKYLDLSNLDLTNCNSYENMFSNMNSIKHINLDNFSKREIILKIFNEIDNKIFVCQKDNIITHSKVYICCNFNFKTDKCYSNSDIDTAEETNVIDSPVIKDSSNTEMNTDNLNDEDIINQNINRPKNSSKKMSFGIIIVIIMSVIVLIAGIIFVVFCLCKKKAIEVNFSIEVIFRFENREDIQQSFNSETTVEEAISSYDPNLVDSRKFKYEVNGVPIANLFQRLEHFYKKEKDKIIIEIIKNIDIISKNTSPNCSGMDISKINSQNTPYNNPVQICPTNPTE